MFLAAAVQCSSKSDIAGNLEVADQLIRRAAHAGASLVVTPENIAFLGPHAQKVHIAEPLDGPIFSHFAELARALRIHLVLGSHIEQIPGETQKTWNTAVLYGPDGDRLGFYRKIHLYDVDVPGGAHFSESKTVVPGDHITVVKTALGTIGLSICYDLRFAELYRAMTDAGAEILTLSAAFTAPTGKDHWLPLVRARAIECQSFLIAAGQCGTHDDRGLRASWGHSLLCDPWGNVVGGLGDSPGFAIAPFDLAQVSAIRRAIPMAAHRRLPLSQP